MKLHEMSHNRKTNSHPAISSCRSAVGLAKAIEDIGQEFFFDADSVVVDGGLNIRATPLQTDLNHPSLGRELHCVGE